MKDDVILLVEDNPDDVELIKLSLREQNICNDIIVARDGAEALDYLFATGAHAGRDINSLPSLVLLDLKMPKVDGFEVLQRIRADGRTKLVPVVILTSSREERDIARSYNLGVNSYVSKPVDFAEFNSAVKELGLYWLLLNRRATG